MSKSILFLRLIQTKLQSIISLKQWLNERREQVWMLL